MALADHDRLDKKLDTVHYTDARCGSLNLKTGQAEYCGYDCPALRARMDAGEDPGTPVNHSETVYKEFDPATIQ